VNTYIIGLCQRIGAFRAAPTRMQVQFLLLMTGVSLLAMGIANEAIAQVGDPAEIKYNGQRLTDSVNAILTYLEGSFGALVMVCAGLGAIMSSAFGQYKASLGCLIVAIGSFILRSFMDTFFNTDGIQE
jgi:hypothetical protein